MAIQIVIADSQEEYRKELCDYLSNQKDFKIVGVAGDSYEAIKLVDIHKPDIVIMESNLPLGDGIKTAALIKYRSPNTSIIVNWDGGERRIFSILFNGVAGYITKKENKTLICHAIRAVYYGGNLVAPELVLMFRTIASNLAENIIKPLGELHSAQFDGKRNITKESSSAASLPQTISHSEKQIMGFVGQGYTNREIAEKLCLTEGTVRNYVSSLLQKTGFRDRTQVAIYATKTGL